MGLANKREYAKNIRLLKFRYKAYSSQKPYNKFKTQSQANNLKKTIKKLQCTKTPLIASGKMLEQFKGETLK